MFTSTSIGTRMGYGFGLIIAAAIAAFAATGWVGNESLSATHAAYNAAASRIDAVQQMQSAQLEAISTLRNAGLLTNGRAVKTEIAAYAAAMRRLETAEAHFAGEELDSASRELLNQAKALRRNAAPVITEATELMLSLAGEEGARVLSSKLSPLQRQWMDKLQQLNLHEKALAQSRLESIAHTNAQKTGGLAVVLLTVLTGGSVFATWFTRSVTGRLRKAVDVAERVAHGNLHVHIDAKGRDEISSLLQALKTMVVHLADVVDSVRESANTVADASQEINKGNMDLSVRTERQAKTLAETSASISDLSEAVNRSAEHAEHARGLATQTASAANLAGDTMGQVVRTMSRISESSKRISEIIGVIEGIAFQTNILALNAAVEAARAGEQGRGFAVVATEVRALAQRVATAAHEVRTLITQSTERVVDGSQQVANMGGTMQQLVASADHVKALLVDIATAYTAQRLGLVEVTTAVRDIDCVTQQNAALVQQVAAVAQSLVSQTGLLGSAVSQFEMDDRDRDPDCAPRTPLALSQISSN